MIRQFPSEGLESTQPSSGNGRMVRPRAGFAAPASLRVLLLTEGTYPYHFGGVSTWCHTLVQALPDVRFELMAIIGDRKLEPRFNLPPNVDGFHPISMWGTYDLLETRQDLSFAQVRQQRRRTSEEVIEESFIPAFRTFLEYLLSRELAATRLAQSIVQMHRFFLEHDFDAALRSRAAWRTFHEVVGRNADRLARQSGGGDCSYTLADLTRGMQWVYRWLFPLARPLPRVDVVHAAMAGLCTIIAVTAKLEHGAGYLLTEHGIYLREAYLSAGRAREGWLLKVLRTSFARRMAELSYAWADQVGPVCSYNHRWELKVGAAPDRLRTMYYGVDSNRFQPVERATSEPVVGWVGRIDPLKDVKTLLRAAALVHRERADVRFRLYGAPLPGTEGYHAECLALQHELGLEQVVSFAGYVSQPAKAFNDSDVVVMSSISEAVPYSILEAMLCGKPVIATAVGGIPEQLAGCGVLVEPRNAEQMAAAILELMNDPERRAQMGAAAREQAIDKFGIPQFASDHRQSYRWIARHPRRRAYPPPRPSPHRRVSEPLDAAAVAQAGEMVQKVAASPPVDSLEVAALLESIGITDQIAVSRYRAADVFEVAEAVYGWLRDTGGQTIWPREEEETQSGWLRPLREVARGPLAIVQSVLLLAVIITFAQFGGWQTDRIIALGLGMTTSILLVSVLIQALGRRPSIYLGLDDRATARAAVRLGTVVAAIIAGLVALVSVAASLLWSPSTSPDTLIFLATFAAFSAIWIAATGAIIARASEWLVLALALGLGEYLLLHLVLGSSGPQIGIESAAAVTVTILVVLAGGKQSLSDEPDQPPVRAILPSHGYLIQEAWPYLAYGLLYMIFFVMPHLLSWPGLLPPRMSRATAIGMVEHWLALGLPPLLFATGLAELAAGAFWRRASSTQGTTPGGEPGRFGRVVLRSLYLPHLGGLLVVLSITSAGTWLLLESGAAASLSPWLSAPDGSQAQLIFNGALVAYALLGWGLFNCTFTLSLARPQLALGDLLPAALVALAVGIPLSIELGFGYAVIGFAAGSLVLVLTSSRTAWTLLRSADYHYFASV